MTPRRLRPSALRKPGKWCAAGALIAALAACGDRWRPADAFSFARYETRLRAQGLLRTDRAPADHPVTRETLIRNFERIAFYEEYTVRDGVLTRSPKAVRLRRWGPFVRYRLAGDGVRAADKSAVRAVFDRIARLTGQRFQPSDDAARLVIMILGPRDRAALRASARPDPGDVVTDWLNRPDFACFGRTRFSGPDGGDSAGLIGVRDEVRGVLRRSCFEEEIAQTLGLGNDHPAVRPSAFNDDEEFAYLTRHDELLLRILYDPRLRPGMTAAEAMPIVRRIVGSLEM